MNVLSVLTIIVLSFLAVGFLIGFCRGWVKSLVRFGIILVALLVSVFLSPVLSKLLINKFVEGSTIAGFGFSANIEEIVAGLLGDDIAADLFTKGGTTGELSVAIINVIMNMVAFLLLFFIIILVSLIIYWIVVLCLHLKNRHDGIKPEKDKKYWWLKVLGGGIGFVSSLMFVFILLTPVYGVMNICDKFVASEKTESASAVTIEGYVGGELYYTGEKGIGKVESYIEKYAKFRKSYNKSFVGVMLKYTGVEKMGASTFDRLTNVRSGDLDLNVTNELLALVEAYNIYKYHFIVNDFDLANNESIDGIMEIYDIANESAIVKSYIEEFVPKICNRWLNGEKFLGIEMPVGDEFKPVVNEVLTVFNTANSTRLKANVKAVVGAIKVANNNDVIVSVREGKDLIQILSGSGTFVKEEIVQLSSTNELRHVLPNTLNKFIELAYDDIVGGDAEFEDLILTNQQIDAIDWEVEGAYLQGMTSKTLFVYNNIKDSNNKEDMANLLSDIGEAIDLARKSVTVSKPFKIFIEGFVLSDNVKLDADVKNELATTISEQWDDSDYSFATTFTALEEAVLIAQNLNAGSGSISLENMSGVLSSIIASESSQNTINQILGSGIVTDILGENDTASAITEVVDMLVNKTNSDEELDKAISSGQEIVDIIDASLSDDGFVLEGETIEQKEQTAKTTLENIAKSDAVMDMLDKSADDSNSSLGSLLENVGGDANILKDSIEGANLTQEQKDIFNKIFA